ncbi:hypothetical protein NSTC745_04744 [Nostoc sp. DSM 114161]|uniref:hypothetical protein n=1 Tax=Nostoc sp. DSM 114161 TaxID=3440143 RepID=UPI0040461BB4
MKSEAVRWKTKCRVKKGWRSLPQVSPVVENAIASNFPALYIYRNQRSQLDIELLILDLPIATSPKTTMSPTGYT